MNAPPLAEWILEHKPRDGEGRDAMEGGRPLEHRFVQFTNAVKRLPNGNDGSVNQERFHRPSRRRVKNMSDKQNKVSEGHVRLESLPLEVQRLAEAMQSIDPKWSVEAWLIEQANMSMDLVKVDVARERLAVEQRLHRLEMIARRLEPDSQLGIDPLQKNIFDCFNLDIDEAIKGLGARAAQPQTPTKQEHDIDDARHPAATFLDLLPDDEGDDPLLAVACQMLLVVVETQIAKGDPFATLDVMFKGMNEHGITPEEIDEAIDHLLTIGSLIEVDDDCFVPTA